MIYVLGVLFFLFAFLLICAILLQEGKGGGLAAMSGAMTDSVMGAKNPLRRVTVVFFVGFILLVLALNYNINRENNGEIAPGLAPIAQPAPVAAPAIPGGNTATPALPSGAIPVAAPANPVTTAPAAPQVPATTGTVAAPEKTATPVAPAASTVPAAPAVPAETTK